MTGETMTGGPHHRTPVLWGFGPVRSWLWGFLRREIFVVFFFSFLEYLAWVVGNAGGHEKRFGANGVGAARRTMACGV